MTSSDLRDVLNLPDGLSGPRPPKKQKISAPRPNLKGLAREVHNLGGDNPIAIVPEVTQFKKRRLVSRKPAARWELKSFRNSGREDPSLVLRHWRRKENARDEADTTTTTTTTTTTAAAAAEEPPQDVENSSFAKFNVQVSVPQYSDDQYQQVLQNPDWTKEETDYLMGLARDFDIRWPLVWDRYEWNPAATDGDASADGDESKAVVPARRNRTMEELKARYYEVASKMMAVQKPVQYMTQPEFALHELMAHFNPQQEKLRKDFALNALSRSMEEAREEESLLLEIKRILARSERFNEERKELYNRLDYPHAEQDISTFKSSAGLQTLLQNLMSADKSKKRKSIMGAEQPGQAAASASASAAQQAVVPPEPVRRESTATSASQRDSSAPSGKKSATQQQQAQPQAPQQAERQQAQERRKLTEQEEAVYGVTHHDRLGSGPTFRTEKINKLFSHKSNQQQLRITNTLNELDVPSKLAMPTAATTQAFEQLLASVNSLLDARKVSDKLDAELKLETAKKAEIDARRAGREEEEGDDDEGGGKDADQGEEGQEEVEGVDGNADKSRKRSGSVMSALSDKSAKRVKK